MKWILEPGEFQVIVGTSSDNGMQSTFEVLDPRNPNASAQDIKPMIDPPPANPIPTAQISPEDDAFLEDVSKRSFMFLWDHTNPKNGLTLDRSGKDGTRKPAGHRSHNIASIAASGFALTGYCIAADRSWIPKEQLKERTRNTLDHFANKAFHNNGWFYHWADYETGERRWNSEISSIDTALLLGGIMSVKQCFSDDSADRSTRR